MSKRKQPDFEPDPSSPSKRPRRATPKKAETPAEDVNISRRNSSAPQKTRTTPKKQRALHDDNLQRSGSPTPKPNGKTLFSTPKKGSRSAATTPSKQRADQSAKRKSARLLAEVQDEEDWDGENALAEAILQEEAEAEDQQESIENADNDDATTPTATPKRGRGRPKGSRNKRSPTPEGDIAPEERYFFQNRAGPSQISDNPFSAVKLLTHDEYFEEIRKEHDQHKTEKAYLMKLHARSFPQWKFEIAEGHNVCLYGYGSKRDLTRKFVEWLHAKSDPPPKIVIVNGYTKKLSIKSVLNTIGSASVAEEETLKLGGQPQEMLDALLAHLTNHRPQGRLIVIVNSIDSASLRKTGVHAILARLAAHPSLSLVATSDTPTFPLLWNSTLLDQFNFAFHDCTTFASYDAELSVVDDVYDLLGRKGRRMGGKEGIKYVLKSLPPNAQNLYRILLGEILSILSNDIDGHIEEDVDMEDGPRRRPGNEAAEEVGIEYRLLYQKASEEFVASSDMNFRFLLKEFHDHQMITSRRDASGTELLCVPLGKEEMQAVLEDLVIS